MTVDLDEGSTPGATPPATTTPDPSTVHLLQRLGLVEQRVRDEVARRRAVDPDDVDDQFRGLFITDLQVDHLLGAGSPGSAISASELADQREDIERSADALVGAGGSLRLRDLVCAFDLEPLDEELLLVALAPDVDRRFETLYGYLNDDVSRRRATVGLALQLSGTSPASGRGRGRLGPSAPLVRRGLLQVLDTDRPVLTRELRAADRVVSHLLGDDGRDPLLTGLVADVTPVVDGAAIELARAMSSGARLGYVRADRGSAGASTAAGALEECGRGALGLDLTRLSRTKDVEVVALAASREAGLRGAGLVAGPVEALDAGDAATVRALADAAGTVVLYGKQVWDPRWSDDVPTVVHAERISAETQADIWAEALGDDRPADVDPNAATALFRLTPDQVRRAAAAARTHAAAQGRPITQQDLQRGARAQNAAGLQRLARRISPTATWDDIVLPPGIMADLRELAVRWQHRDLVLETWELGRGTARGRGVSALFAGESGTGKTLATEVIAAELGLDLYVVDLSTVVDKYIGETSKNLDRIFDEADRVNGVLLFDEADALFGKRSQVSDSKDRHANLEVAFLLQRMEAFDGVAILTTNLAANLDEAFMRRLDAIVDFPTPDEAQRVALWRAKLTTALPQAGDIDVDLLASRFKLSGSEIQNVVVGAAYRAAEENRAVTMEDLVRATVREHRKVGRHIAASELEGFEHLQTPRV